MAEKRKLQAEIDKTMKKVDEGIDEFDEIWEKVKKLPPGNSTSGPNLKDKLESDLKREIKKLQRIRDQIKTWLNLPDIKDKKPLLEARKRIETEMERFKVCEREFKMKQYSKEGLASQGKVDPHEAERTQHRKWIHAAIQSLSSKQELYEADLEAMLNKKGRQKDNERIEQLKTFIDQHKWHVIKLEQILRRLDNDSIELDLLKDVQSNVELYIQQHDDADFYHDDQIYVDLNLDDVDLDKDSDYEGDDHESVHTTSTSNTAKVQEAREKEKEKEKKPAPVPVFVTAPASSDATASVLSALSAEPKPSTAAPAPVPAPAAGRGRGAAAKPAPAPVSTVPPSVSVTIKAGPSTPTNAAAAAAAPSKAKADGGATNQWSMKDAVKEAAHVGVDEEDIKGGGESGRVIWRGDTVHQKMPSVVEPSISSTPTAVQESREEEAALAAVDGSAASTSVQHDGASASLNDGAAYTAQPAAASFQGQGGAEASVVSTGDVGVPVPEVVPKLPPGERWLGNENTQWDLLLASYNNIQHKSDAQKAKVYNPRNPYPFPALLPYPKMPLSYYDSPGLFERFDLDTLFFIFYYQQGTYQQYMAAKELKKQSWRFHKKYHTWFQRHEEPKVTAEDYETGTYVYFDFETGWCSRVKSDFTFEYQYLEDDPLL